MPNQHSPITTPTPRTPPQSTVPPSSTVHRAPPFETTLDDQLRAIEDHSSPSPEISQTRGPKRQTFDGDQVTYHPEANPLVDPTTSSMDPQELSPYKEEDALLDSLLRSDLQLRPSIRYNPKYLSKPYGTHKHMVPPKPTSHFLSLAAMDPELKARLSEPPKPSSHHSPSSTPSSSDTTVSSPSPSPSSSLPIEFGIDEARAQAHGLLLTQIPMYQERRKLEDLPLTEALASADSLLALLPETERNSRHWREENTPRLRRRWRGTTKERKKLRYSKEHKRYFRFTEAENASLDLLCDFYGLNAQGLIRVLLRMLVLQLPRVDGMALAEERQRTYEAFVASEATQSPATEPTPLAPSSPSDLKAQFMASPSSGERGILEQLSEEHSDDIAELIQTKRTLQDREKQLQRVNTAIISMSAIEMPSQHAIHQLEIKAQAIEEEIVALQSRYGGTTMAATSLRANDSLSDHPSLWYGTTETLLALCHGEEAVRHFRFLNYDPVGERVNVILNDQLSQYLSSTTAVQKRMACEGLRQMASQVNPYLTVDPLLFIRERMAMERKESAQRNHIYLELPVRSAYAEWMPPLKEWQANLRDYRRAMDPSLKVKLHRHHYKLSDMTRKEQARLSANYEAAESRKLSTLRNVRRRISKDFMGTPRGSGAMGIYEMLRYASVHQVADPDRLYHPPIVDLVANPNALAKKSTEDMRSLYPDVAPTLPATLVPIGEVVPDPTSELPALPKEVDVYDPVLKQGEMLKPLENADGTISLTHVTHIPQVGEVVEGRKTGLPMLNAVDPAIQELPDNHPFFAWRIPYTPFVAQEHEPFPIDIGGGEGRPTTLLVDPRDPVYLYSPLSPSGQRFIYTPTPARVGEEHLPHALRRASAEYVAQSHDLLANAHLGLTPSTSDSASSEGQGSDNPNIAEPINLREFPFPPVHCADLSEVIPLHLNGYTPVYRGYWIPAAKVSDVIIPLHEVKGKFSEDDVMMLTSTIEGWSIDEQTTLHEAKGPSLPNGATLSPDRASMLQTFKRCGVEEYGAFLQQIWLAEDIKRKAQQEGLPHNPKNADDLDFL